MCASKASLSVRFLIAAWLLIACVSISSALTAAEIGYEPHNKATATVTVLISPINGHLEYIYDVKNSTSSERAITSFKIQIDVPVSSATTTGPTTWDSFDCCIQDKNRMLASNIVVGGWLYGVESSQIQPGATLSGFKITAQSVPGIKRYFIESNSATVVPEAEPGDQEEADALTELTDFFNDTTSGVTLGPEPVPDLIDPTSLIDRLIAFMHQSVSLGWFFGHGSEGIVKSLDAKLDAAKVSIARGQNKTAVNQLNAFVKELQAERDKHVNGSAFLLLKLNVDFIVGKLGS
ncbi:MAG: hypothetical protein HYV14_08015 [Elusimicrobia bacterium]|nr:hypothetical protein [Elusimicrobiota bacterium]